MPTKVANFFLDLVFPKICQGCQAEGTYFCPSCQLRVKPPITRCFVCNKNSLLGQTHAECGSKNFALDGLMVAAPYETLGIRDLIWNLKYNGVTEISEALGLILADYLIHFDLLDFFISSLVVPVPLHRLRQKLRGFNQAEFIARNFASRLGLAFVPALQRSKKIKSQVDLERRDRFENVKNAFLLEAKIDVSGKQILLIDDVATTGATLNECAKILRKNGASQIWGLVLARN